MLSVVYILVVSCDSSRNVEVGVLLQVRAFDGVARVLNNSGVFEQSFILIQHGPYKAFQSKEIVTYPTTLARVGDWPLRSDFGIGFGWSLVGPSGANVIRPLDENMRTVTARCVTGGTTREQNTHITYLYVVLYYSI